MINVCLHGATLATRFLFVFFLAKSLDPVSVGYYGLFTATVGYSLYFVGLDFYTYATREIVKTPMAERGRLLKGQAVLSGGLYLFFSPVACALLFFCSGWPTYLIVWFLPILVLEHFNQEMSRLLIALSEQISASTVLFIRQGSWALASVALMRVDKGCRHLMVVILLWAIAGLVAAMVAIYKLNKLGLGGWQDPLDRVWIKRGVVVSASFLLATLALRGFQTIDRYFLVAMGGIEIAGPYTLFIGVTGSLFTFLDAGVFSFAYPTLIKLYQNNEFDRVRVKMRQIFWVTILLTAGFSVGSWIALPFLLKWIGKNAYISALYLYPWLLVATIFNAVGLVPHCALYASGQDRPIIISHIAALISFVISVLILVHHSGLLAVPQGLMMAFLVILVWKTIAYWRNPVPSATVTAHR